MKRFLSLAIVSVALSAAASTAGAFDIFGHPIFPIGPPHGPGLPIVPVPAPEIDPASAMAGLTLLAGGLAVLRGRRAQKSGD